MILKYPLILGSGSPRRKEILINAGFEFQTKKSSIDESYPHSILIDEVAEYVANKKLKSYQDIFDEHTILCADTIVVLKNNILGKPRNQKQACEMLRALSGNEHMVLTGVAIKSPESKISFTSRTRVKFHELTESEIQKYVHSGLSTDKAGAYGIQDWIGLIGIESIGGDYNNVVGLPISAVYQVLQKQFC